MNEENDYLGMPVFLPMLPKCLHTPIFKLKSNDLSKPDRQSLFVLKHLPILLYDLPSQMYY